VKTIRFYQSPQKGGWVAGMDVFDGTELTQVFTQHLGTTATETTNVEDFLVGFSFLKQWGTEIF